MLSHTDLGVLVTAAPAAHLVSPDALVPVDEVLADHELVGVHHVQQLPARREVHGGKPAVKFSVSSKQPRHSHKRRAQHRAHDQEPASAVTALQISLVHLITNGV
eukprot:GHRQ01029784.1.p2 GENE.GHRQ01029784.1~~GHRQ01029784.1.p2  ORF type:complete len:105 (-),score=8.48 GHRQ01029784.1:249-563(-)